MSDVTVKILPNGGTPPPYHVRQQLREATLAVGRESKHWFGLPINGLDNFEALRATEDWNGFPVPLVPHIYAAQIAEAVGDPIPAPYEGLQPYTGLCWQIDADLPEMAATFGPFGCPQCGSPLNRDVVVIESPALTGHGQPTRVSRLGAAYLCTGCEYCVEADEHPKVTALRAYADAQEGAY